MQKKSYTPEFKAKVVLELLTENKTTSEIASKYEVNIRLIQSWRKEFLENTGRVFGETKIEKNIKNKEKELEQREKILREKVGELTIENDWLKKKSIEIFGKK